MINHIVTIFYNPTDDAKKLYDGMKASGQRVYLINAGSLLDRRDDPWIGRNITFETDFEDNIAHLNPHFCEMTALYCAWKNLLPGWNDDDWVQHSHYRKVLQVESPPRKDADIYVCHTSKTLCLDETSGKLESMSNGQLMRTAHPKPNFDALDETLSRSLDEWSLSMWRKWCEMDAFPAPINIFMMKARLFREYCEWAFPKLFSIDANIPYDNEEYRTKYQRRAMSFIGERLTSLWCYMKAHSGFNVLGVPDKLYDFKPMTDAEERHAGI